jgi:nucleotide-binding universal stress UspA family protein
VTVSIVAIAAQSRPRRDRAQINLTTAITIEASRQTISTASMIFQVSGIGDRDSMGGQSGAKEGRLLFVRIVVGTDGSDTASEAVRQAVELAKSLGANLDVVSAFEPVPRERLREESSEIPGDVAYSVGPREDVNQVLEAAAGPAREQGVEVNTHAREGDPADAILDVAEETNADLVIVGNKGMTGARRFLLGSVPNKISHHAPCSVLIVRTT